jgi:hypothetical protein
MAIIIKKKQALGLREAAPLVEGAETAKAAPTEEAPKVRTVEEALHDWKVNHPPVGAKPKQCPYCGHFYIMPCKADAYKGCLNWKFKQGLIK